MVVGLDEPVAEGVEETLFGGGVDRIDPEVMDFVGIVLEIGQETVVVAEEVDQFPG